MEKTVKLSEKVEVVATAKDPYHKAGEKYMIHPSHVDYLTQEGLIEVKKAKKE